MTRESYLARRECPEIETNKFLKFEEMAYFTFLLVLRGGGFPSGE